MLPLTVLLFVLTMHTARAGNQILTYQGLLTNSNDEPYTTSQTVSFAIYSPSPGSCLLYSETQTVTPDSKGRFTAKIGTGSRTDGLAHSFAKIFVNGGVFSGLTCASGTSYSPAATDSRFLTITVAGTTLTPSVEVAAVPFAMQAQEIAGYGVSDLVKIHPTTGSATTFTTAEMATAKSIVGLSCSSNQIMKWNGTAWACAADDAGSASSDASYSAKGQVQFDTNAATSGITVASGVAKLSNTGVAASNYGSATSVPSLSVDAQGRITSASSTAIALPITQLTQSGATTGQVLKWNGTAWSAGADLGITSDSSYASKGLVQFDTDAATSGITINSGIARLNTGSSANQIVKLDGTGKLPAVDGSALINIAATTYTGVLPIASGGTNSATVLNNNRLMLSSSGAIVEAPAMTNGQIVVGSTGAAPQVATLGSSNGISITTGAGSLSISTNATSLNTASAIVARDATGNFTAGAITNNSNILKGSTSGTLTMTVPATVTSYTLKWPSAVGSAGQFLSTDASGNLSWGSPAGVADGSYSAKGILQGLTDAATSGLNISSGVISVNSGVAANQIVKLNGSAQLPAVDGSLLTNLGAGNIASGVLPIARGGTNNGTLSVSAGGMIYSDGSKLMNTGAGTSGQALISAGSGAPAFGTLGVSGGGTGVTSFAPNSLVIANGTGSGLNSMTCSLNQILKWDGTAWSCAADATGTASGDAGYGSGNKGIVAFDTDASTSGMTVTSGLAKVNSGTGPNQILKLDGSSRIPAVDGSLLTNLSAGSFSSGTLPVARGGTNSSTALNNNRVMISSGGAIVEAPAMSNGQVLIGATGSAPQAATLGASNGISITTGAGALSIATNATDANIASTIVARDASGNFAANSITGKSYLLKGATTGILTMNVPASVSSYTLTWPSSVGSAGQVLSTDGSGNLSWATASGSATDATYSSKGIVQGLTDAATSGLNISSGLISVNSGTGPNQIVKLNGSSQLPMVDGSQLTNLSASNIGTGVLPIARGGTNNSSLAVTAGGVIATNGTQLVNTGSGSAGQALVSSGGSVGFGTVGVNGGGTGLTSGTTGGLLYFSTANNLASTAALTQNGVVLGGGASAPTTVSGTANQVLRVPSGGGAPSFGTLDIASGGTGATAFTGNRLVGTTGIGVATGMTSVTCSMGQLLSFDASGNYGCYNHSDVFGGVPFVNGGNTFTAAAHIGTNDGNPLNLRTNGNARLSITATGNVGIGTSVPSNTFEVTKVAGNSTSAFSTYSSTLGQFTTLSLRKSNSNTESTATTALNQILGKITFEGVTSGSSFAPGATIQAVQNASAGSFTVPTSLEFNVQDSSGSLALMKLDSSSTGGKVAIGTTSSITALEVQGHIAVTQAGANPPSTTCGTGAGVSGNDTRGVVTVGSGASTCTVSFGTPFSAAPVCVVSWFFNSQAATSASIGVYSVSMTSFTVSSNVSMSGTKFNYICFQ